MNKVFMTRYFTLDDFKNFVKRIKKESPNAKVRMTTESELWRLWYVIEAEGNLQEVIDAILKYKHEHDVLYLKGCTRVYPDEIEAKLILLWRNNDKLWEELDVEYIIDGI